MKSRKETPCCHQLVRVKIVEPGIQARKCDLCKQVSYFTLEHNTIVPDRLRFRWLTDSEAEEMGTVEGELDISEL